MRFVLWGVIGIATMLADSCLRSLAPGSLVPDDHERITGGNIAGESWSLSAYRKADGTVCTVLRFQQDDFGSCNGNLRGQPGGGRHFLDWYALEPGTGASVLGGAAAKQVASVLIHMRDGTVLHPQLIDAGYPLLFFGAGLDKPAGQPLFVALNEDGELLEASPKLMAPWARQVRARFTRA